MKIFIMHYAGDNMMLLSYYTHDYNAFGCDTNAFQSVMFVRILLLPIFPHKH